MSNLRFDPDCDNFEEAKEYLINRSIQLSPSGAKLINIVERRGSAVAYFRYQNKDYISIYIYKSQRGNNLYQKIWNEWKLPVITIYSCKIIKWLSKNNIPYIIPDNLIDSIEYSIVQDFYGDIRAKRSGIFYMNHIDEGLKILELIGASEDAKLAFCLHPIVQNDKDLYNALYIPNSKWTLTDLTTPHSVVTAMEYRSAANDYLSFKTINSIDEIRLSPLKDVNDMLIADKIQNYKDFLKYLKDIHPRSKELNQYFLNWLERLKVNNYQELMKEIE